MAEYRPYQQRRYGSAEIEGDQKYVQYILDAMQFVNEQGGTMAQQVPNDVTGAAAKETGKIKVLFKDSQSVVFKADTYTYDEAENSYDFWVDDDDEDTLVATVPYKQVMYIAVLS